MITIVEQKKLRWYGHVSPKDKEWSGENVWISKRRV